MGKSNITTETLDEIVEVINYVYRDAVCSGLWEPDKSQHWRDWWVKRIHVGYKPSARPYACRVVAELCVDVLDSLLNLFMDTEALRNAANVVTDQAKRQEREFAAHVEQWARERAGLQAEIERLNRTLNDLVGENEMMQLEITRLQKRLKSRPTTDTVVIPAQTVEVKGTAKQVILRLMGDEGLGRSERLAVQVAEIGGVEIGSARNALTKLVGEGLVDHFRDNRGKLIGWSFKSRGARNRLLVLTDRGREWFRGAYNREPVESEIIGAVKRHTSPEHAVGILETRDYLRSAGYQVDDDPAPVLAREDEPWQVRAEPDLIAVIDGENWPVEVQREVAQRQQEKWSKTLELVGRLVIVLFTEDKRRNQESILRGEIRFRRLPHGQIRLTSLEAMASGEWRWIALNS